MALSHSAVSWLQYVIVVFPFILLTCLYFYTYFPVYGEFFSLQRFSNLSGSCHSFCSTILRFDLDVLVFVHLKLNFTYNNSYFTPQHVFPLRFFFLFLYCLPDVFDCKYAR